MSAVTDRPADGAPTTAVVMAQAADENFPVAAWFLGRDVRDQLMAIYGFARLVDDIGDEAAGDRLALLDWVEGELDLAFAGGKPEHPVMRALASAIRARPLPDQPFRRLIKANRQDQTVARYESFDELLAYCRLSAAPVGELVLHVFSAATDARLALSEKVCAGLQVIEHLQDVAEDYARGRIYLPRADLVRFGCREEELGARTASSPVRAVVSFESDRARRLLDAGAPLAATLPLRPRLAVAAFVGGGRSALRGIAARGYDVLARRPGRPTAAFLAGWGQAVLGN